eukprot:13394510-Ditylum_brightwellii.AAC.1
MDYSKWNDGVDLDDLFLYWMVQNHVLLLPFQKVALEEEAKIGLDFITAEIEKDMIEAKKKEEKRKRTKAHAVKA